MIEPSRVDDRKLKIVHVLRAPLGGLFRHVLDLANGQIARGHAVGLIADASTGGATAEHLLAALAPKLELGLRRFPMRRNPHPSDLPALVKVMSATRAMQPDVIHGHGSKGALYARLPGLFEGGRGKAVRVYTPHGGSLHYAPGTLLHGFYMRVERLLSAGSDLILFESAYIGARYRASVGEPRCVTKIVLNGIAPQEFEPIPPEPGSSDFVYVGELRAAKGIDVFLEAIASASNMTGRKLTAVLVGSGPDRDSLGALAEKLGLHGQITFPGAMPARQAFAKGRILVMPSRAESLPYVALEAAAAQVPLIATNVGGLPEVFGPCRDRLVPPGDYVALRDRLVIELQTSDAALKSHAATLSDYVRSRFCIDAMVDTITESYAEALAMKASRRAPVSHAPHAVLHRTGLR